MSPNRDQFQPQAKEAREWPPARAVREWQARERMFGRAYSSGPPSRRADATAGISLPYGEGAGHVLRTYAKRIVILTAIMVWLNVAGYALLRLQPWAGLALTVLAPLLGYFAWLIAQGLIDDRTRRRDAAQVARTGVIDLRREHLRGPEVWAARSTLLPPHRQGDEEDVDPWLAFFSAPPDDEDE